MPSPRPNNHQIMALQARGLFLTYDQDAIIAKSPVTFDETFLYLPVLDRAARVSRSTGEVCWLLDGTATPATPHETLTVFDYLCDASPTRSLSGQWKSMASFGLQFHSGMLESSAPSPLETAIDQNPEAFRRACIHLGGSPFPNCDIGFSLPLFPDLPVALAFWRSDEEFPPQTRWFWDGNALQYLRYETMHYAVGLISARLRTLLSR